MGGNNFKTKPTMKKQKSLNPSYESHMKLRRRDFNWLNTEFQESTNSGFPLIDVEITPDYEAVQCPRCESCYELTEQHIIYRDKFYHKIRVIDVLVVGIVCFILGKIL